METKNSDSLHENIKEQKEEICKNSPNLSKEVVDDLEAALGRLNSLTFQDAQQKDSFFKNVQCLQGYHIVQIFNAWAALHLQDSLKDPPKTTREIMRLFEICTQFCYSPDMSNRVSFEVFIRTVKFCFPSDSKKHHFSTKIVLILLELVRILQEGRLIFPFLDLQKKTFCIKSATDLFNDQIAILEARDYDEEDIIKIISQAAKFAQADSQRKFHSELTKALFPDLQDMQVPSDKVPAIFFRIWGDLLQLTKKGDVAFILRLANEDLFHTSLSGTVSPLRYMVNVLQELERKGEQVDLGFGKQRLDIFFRHICEIFRDGNEMIATSLKIFSCKKVNDTDLAEVCKLLFSRFREPGKFPTYEVQCFDSIRKLLNEIPDGSLVIRVLQFWISAFPNDLEKAELKKLLDFFTGLIIKQSAESENYLKEKGEHLLEYLQDTFKLPLVHFWSGTPGAWEEFQRSAYSFLGCLSQQAHLSKDAKGKMVALFARCFDRTGKYDQFSCELIKSLCICKDFSVEYRESFYKEVANFSEHLNKNEKDIILAFVSKVSTFTSSLVRNQEVFSEQSKTSRQTRSKEFQLIMDLAKSPLPSGKTDNLLFCCATVLKLASSAAAIVKEGAEEHFHLLFSVVFETLNGSKSLCEVFSIKLQKMTELHFDDGVSVDVLTIWNVVVAGLLAIGLFNDEVDLHCCLPIFARAKGFHSPFEALQLYFELRRVFSRVMLLLRDSRQSGSREPLPQGPPRNLVFALRMIVQSDLSTSDAKLRLIHKLYLLVQRNPRLLIRNVLPCALMNVITLSCEIRQSSKMKHLDFDHIATIIERPEMVEQLGNIPSTPSKSICSVLCSNISARLTIDDVVKIIDCAASFRDARKVSQEDMIPLLESTTKVCSSATEVVHLLKEADEILRKTEPQMMPLAISIFSYLVENNVNAKERAAFITLVASVWETACDSSVCVRYAIPHILWKTYESTKNRKGMNEAMDHIQEVIARVKDLETRVTMGERESSANSEHGGNDLRDLERLALHSSLSCEDVALCFHLSRCYPGVRRLNCFNRYADSSTRRQASLLTPATIAEIMIVQLRRLFGDDKNLFDLAVQLWNSLFTNEYSTCLDEFCKSCENSSTCNDVVNLFLSCLEKAFYFEVIPHWFNNDNRQGLSQHHIVQCSDVVSGSCGWKAKNVDKEQHLMIQAAMISILQELLGSSSQFPEMPPFPHVINCFRGLTLQLESLLCILQKGLPFQITFNLLQLARIDLQAATTIATIASLWPCKNEAGKLLEDVKRRFVEEGVRIHPVYRDFVWSMLEACGRLYRDSSHVLIEKLEWLTDLHGLGVLNYGLDRLPNWRRLMTANSLPAHVIDKWCVFFLFTPRENISSRDVDAVLDLSPTSLKLVANASDNIKRCLFSENGSQGTHLLEEVSFNRFIKERLRLARFLSELIHILKLRMPEKTFIDAIVEEIVVEACSKLCMSHLEKIKKEEDKVKNKTQEAEDKQRKEEDKTKKTEDKSKKGGDVAKKKKGQKTKRTIAKKERKSKEDKSKEIQARTEDAEDKEGERTGDKRKQTEDKREETDDEPKIAKDKTKSSNPYSILRKTLEALFNEMFAKQSTIVDDQSSLPNSVEVWQGQESKLGATNPVFEGSTLPQDNLPNDVYESMLVLMRRWFSGIANKPTLASKTMKIVQSLLLFSYEKDRSQIEKLPDEIRLQILSFPRNQLLLSQLQAAGYNQGESADSQDLWASPFLKRSCFLRKSEFPSDKRYETELTNVLRLHWIQWKVLLFTLNIDSVKIDEREVPAKDLFGIRASRVEMEKQVEAVKEKVGRIESENVGIKVKQLIREEQGHRARVTKLYKRKETKPCSCKGMCSKVETRTYQGCSCKTKGLKCGPVCKCGSADKPCKNKMEEGKKTKVVAVWENRFLENIKLCSESIPGCYAPNGFHSEKPVICALSVDNRILTVFKEEKGRREEIENVEVKLLDAGLYVYGLHSSGHDYATDELWAAFYKMLLEKRLVPRIVLSNESPGFHWIKKFVQPVKEHPCYWKWHLHCGIVPLEEDYLDYQPIEAALHPWLHGLSEFLTLTKINVARFRFRDFTDAEVVERKEQQAKQVAGKFKAKPQLEQKLRLLHNDTSLIGKLASKLEFAVKKTLTQIVMGEWPTTETVKKHIDMKRLAFIKCEKCKLKIQKCKRIMYQEEYATIVLRVCENLQETLLVLLFYVFLVNLFALD